MPTYRFHMDAVDNGSLDLPDDAAAWREAREFCGQVVRDELRPSGCLELLVIGESGEHIFSISIKVKSS
jgi:hypothetical protein